MILFAKVVAWLVTLLEIFHKNFSCNQHFVSINMAVAKYFIVYGILSLMIRNLFE